MNSSTTVSGINEDALLTKMNREKRALLAPAILYITLILIVGIIGNSLAIYIYGFKWPNSTTRWFLLWLASSDLLSCFISMPTEIYHMAFFYYMSDGTICFITRFFLYLFNGSTGFLFVAMAIDRYIRICHPFRVPMSIFGSKIACIASLVFGVVFSWPAFFLYGRKDVRLPTNQGYINGVMCSIRNDMDNTVYPEVFYISSFVAWFISFLSLCVLYVPVGRVMLKRRRASERQQNVRVQEALESGQVISKDRRRKSTTATLPSVSKEQPSGNVRFRVVSLLPNTRGNGQSKPFKATMMLFAITTVFVLSFVPFYIITIVRQCIGPSFYPSLSPAEEAVVHVFYRSYLAHSCASPIVYGLLNSQFNMEVKKILRMSRCQRNSNISREHPINSLLQSVHEPQVPDS